MRIAIIGSGDLGRQIAHLIHQDTDDQVIGFFDDFETKGTIIHGIPILGNRTDVCVAFDNAVFDATVIAIGYKHLHIRKEIFDDLEGKVQFYTFIHSSCIIDPTARIEKGTILFPGCLIDQNVYIHANSILNIGCTVAHDTIIASHCFLAPRVAIAGVVKVGLCCIIGINATIIDNLEIVSYVQIGAGSVVIKPIVKFGLYVGVPARFVK